MILRQAAAFWTLAALFLMLFFASAAASPLYRVYQAQFHFSAETLTAVFAVYVLVLLATLLFCGSLSDYLGRLPVIIAALVFSVAACGVFLVAHGVEALYVARSVQGIATGLATGPTGAALIDLQPAGSQRAPLVTIFLLCGTGAVAAYLFRGISSRATMLAGCLFLLAGIAVTGGAIAATAAAAFLVGATIAGAGFGLAFLGSFRTVTALATPDDRAGLVAAIYVVGYLAFSVPALIAGVAATTFGLHATALVYSAALVVLAAAATGLPLLRPGTT